MVYDEHSVHAYKWLYASATPRLYKAGAKGRAADRNLEIFSVDDKSVYGLKFYAMAFSQEIKGGWLTDYKVMILTLKAD